LVASVLASHWQYGTSRGTGMGTSRGTSRGTSNYRAVKTCWRTDIHGESAQSVSVKYRCRRGSSRSIWEGQITFRSKKRSFAPDIWEFPYTYQVNDGPFGRGKNYLFPITFISPVCPRWIRHCTYRLEQTRKRPLFGSCHSKKHSRPQNCHSGQDMTRYASEICQDRLRNVGET